MNIFNYFLIKIYVFKEFTQLMTIQKSISLHCSQQIFDKQQMFAMPSHCQSSSSIQSILNLNMNKKYFKIEKLPNRTKNNCSNFFFTILKRIANLRKHKKTKTMSRIMKILLVLFYAAFQQLE